MYDVVKLFQICQILQFATHFFLDIRIVGILVPVEILFDYIILYCLEVAIDDHLNHVDALIQYGLVFLYLFRRHLVEIAHVFEKVLNSLDFFDLDGGAIVSQLRHTIGLYASGPLKCDLRLLLDCVHYVVLYLVVL